MKPVTKRWLLLVALAVALTAGMAVLFLNDPVRSGLLPPCLFYKLTHLYCPGCGSLRALHRLFTGHPIQAFRYNPLMILSLPFVLYGLAAQGLHFFFNIKIPTRTLKARTIWAILAVIILYTIARNIPAYPFALLAPP